MQFSCANAEFNVTTKERLGSETVFKHNGKELHLFGQPEYLVLYEELAYENSPEKVGAASEKILMEYLADPGTCSQLARLKGDFLVLITQDGQLTEIITPDTLQSTDTIYYCHENGVIKFFDDYKYFLGKIGKLGPDSYNMENLRNFFITRTCIPGQTYLADLYRLRPNTIYKVIGGKVLKEKILFFPKTSGPALGSKDLLKVVGMRMNDPEYSVAYSTGIDSHHGFWVARDRVPQLVTVYPVRPYQSYQKTREVGAAFINSIKFDKKLTIVPVDYDDPANLDYLDHMVASNPFKSNLNLFMYHLMKHAICDHVITGELSDEFWCISESRAWGFKDLFTTPGVAAQIYHRLRTYVHQCRSLKGASQVDLAAKYAAARLQTGSEAELNQAAELENLWPLSVINMLNGVVTANVDIWNNPARYHGKTMRFPFAEPLVHYVVVNYPKPFTSLLDPKREIRKHHEYLCHTEIKYRMDLGKTMRDSATSQTCHQRMNQSDPELKRFLDNTAAQANSRLPVRANEGLVFCYELFRQMQA